MHNTLLITPAFAARRTFFGDIQQHIDTNIRLILDGCRDLDKNEGERKSMDAMHTGSVGHRR